MWNSQGRNCALGALHGMLIVVVAVEGSSSELPITCDAPPVVIGEPGQVTCHFHEDILQYRPSISVYKSKGSDLSFRNRDTVLACFWYGDQFKCSTGKGYVFNKNDNSLLTTIHVGIPETSAEFLGSYVCQANIQVALPQVKPFPCTLALKEPGIVTNDATEDFPVADGRGALEFDEGISSSSKHAPQLSSEKKESGDPTVAVSVIVVIIIVVLVVLAIIVVSVIKRRGKNGPNGTKKDDDSVIEVQQDNLGTPSNEHSLTPALLPEQREKISNEGTPLLSEEQADEAETDVLRNESKPSLPDDGFEQPKVEQRVEMLNEVPKQHQANWRQVLNQIKGFVPERLKFNKVLKELTKVGLPYEKKHN